MMLCWVYQNAIMITASIYFYWLRLLFCVCNSIFHDRKFVAPPVDPLILISAAQAVEKIKKREIISTDLIEAYIHRIETINDDINAVVVKLFDTARRQAAEIDDFIATSTNKEIEQRIREQPLLGVPFTMKDALEVEGETITCGIFNRKDMKCDRTAEAVIRLKNAGAILLAITNVPEVCMGVESVNTVYGRSKNPYDTRRMTGGSSGGEGALIGAAGSVVGIGSDIGGSIRMPAFFNGIFGLMPTPGIIPFVGHVPSPTGYKTNMLRVGPMCRFADDLPVLLKIMAGSNAEKLNLDKSRKKLRVFYMEGISGNPIIQPLAEDMRNALRKAVNLLERKYGVVAEEVDLTDAKHTIELFTLSMHENTIDPSFNKLMLCIEGSKGEVNCYTELVNYAIGRSQHTLPGIVTGIIDSQDISFTSSETKEMLLRRDRLKRAVEKLLGDDGILLFPSWPSAAMYHNQPNFAPFDFSYTALWNVLAVPVVQCSIGLNSSGLPLGIQVIGNQYTDRNLITVAKYLEEGFDGWISPGTLQDDYMF